MRDRSYPKKEELCHKTTPTVTIHYKQLPRRHAKDQPTIVMSIRATRKSMGKHTSCRQKEMRCESGNTLQWERKGNLTNLICLAVTATTASFHTYQTSPGTLNITFDILSHCLLRCLDKEHRHMSHRRGRVRPTFPNYCLDCQARKKWR
jgi:hypothetical protein